MASDSSATNHGALTFRGDYYDGTTSQSAPVTVVVVGHELRVSHTNGSLVRQTPFDELRVAPRIGNTARSLRFTDGASIETADNDAVDRALERLRRGGLDRWIHRVEHHRRTAVLGVVGLFCAIGIGFVWGVPLVARHVAQNVPENMARDLGKGTLSTLDTILFKPSQLDEQRKTQLQDAFQGMASHYSQTPLVLKFRRGIANAFALPDGTVVVTDELIALSEDDEEVMAVLAHEIGHVHERHALRMALENSIVALFALAYLGDASQISAVAGSLPALYAHSHFSRAHETEADTFALRFLKQSGIPPHRFADILRRLHAELGGGEEGVSSYFASHPGLEQRAARFTADRNPR